VDDPAFGGQARRAKDRGDHLDDDGATVAKKNKLQPHPSKIPPDTDAAFVAAMEDVLVVYRLPHDPRFPVVCMDESSKQLVGEVHAPIPAAPGHGQLVDHEYVRHGVATLFVEVEPLAGRRHVEVTARRTRQDWARFIKAMLDERYPEAIKVRLVMDNLNTHGTASLYETFPPAEARRLAERLEIHYTPKHGSWLNIAEIELSVLNGQCLRRRIPTIESMRCEISAWQKHRNNRGAPINWRFTTEDARIKLTRLYPKL
jgi:DDE superfamily endonuclease